MPRLPRLQIPLFAAKIMTTSSRSGDSSSSGKGYNPDQMKGSQIIVLPATKFMLYCQCKNTQCNCVRRKTNCICDSEADQSSLFIIPSLNHGVVYPPRSYIELKTDGIRLTMLSHTTTYSFIYKTHFISLTLRSK